MALTGLEMLLRPSDSICFQLIPHIEHAAIKYVFRRYAMANRVRVLNDMNDWNARKVSEYLPSRRAQDLSEDTAIPDTTLVRVRKVTVEPKEVGERYRISDRRVSTDLESIVADVVEAIGKAIGDRVEQDLHATARDTFIGGEFGSSSTTYDLNLMLQAATIFRQRARRGQLFHVIHPFQALPVMEKLIDYTASNNQQLNFRDNSIAELQANNLTEFNLPTFGNVNLSIAEYLPRRVVSKFALYGTGGTFRLQLGDGYNTAVPNNITAAITVSTTPATLITNIDAALNALTMTPYYSGSGSWVTTGSDILDMTITPPSDFFVDDEQQLRIAVQYDDATKASLDGGDVNIVMQKSGYDLVTTLTGGPVGMDGLEQGIRIWERSATARGLVFLPDALVLDIRQAVRAHFDGNINQGRTVEFAGHMKYASSKWSPEKGLFILTKADSPFATG